MTHKELADKVSKFVHGVDSHGNWLMTWKHDRGCELCDRILDFVEKILQDYNKVEGVVYPKL